MTIEEAVAAAEKIPGWMDTDELRWLGERAAEHKVIVEVGSWQGRSTKVLAAMTEGVVYAVDDLTGEADFHEPDLHFLFTAHLLNELAEEKVKIIPLCSLLAANEIKTADMVFIDACHEYPSPKDDIEAWRPIVNGGLLCGHDRDYPGVKRSLEEAAPEYAEAAGSIWVA